MVNQLKKLSPQFRKVLKLTSGIAERAGCKVYLVGGVARDLLLGKDVFDLDIVVEGDAIKLASRLARQLKADFKKHHAFGTATVGWQGHKIDFVTSRSETYSHWGALPKVKPASLVEDLCRRDFTINAIAIGLNKADHGKLIDLYGGLKDLKKGLIRVLHSQSFLEDPTRIFRAIRFEQRFRFKIETHSLSLLKQAIREKALSLVNLHRLRNELILILKELEPQRYIRRLDGLVSLSFIGSGLKLKKEDSKLFDRINKASKHYQKKFDKSRQLQIWLVYLSGLLVRFPAKKIKKILHDFGFKKGERMIVSSIKEGLFRVKKLDSKLAPKVIHRILDKYSFEAILFFYAYYSRVKLRKNIEHFLDELIHSRIELKGRDLKELGFEPTVLYGKLLKRLAQAKLSKALKSKGDEIREVKRIFKRMQKKS
ncbi:MAG: hypothetical protein K9L86_07665 [Candidatus Omnitrophica bacterium]|nr:hypothetical protein [Candidatus Omnitrophota bacterium]